MFKNIIYCCDCYLTACVIDITACDISVVAVCVITVVATCVIAIAAACDCYCYRMRDFYSCMNDCYCCIGD